VSTPAYDIDACYPCALQVPSNIQWAKRPATASEGARSSTIGKSNFVTRQFVFRAFCFRRTTKTFFVVRFFIGRMLKQKRTAKALFAARFFPSAHSKVFSLPSPPRINEVSLF
jgi:hypothetical protein